jgi:hypothetical protein
MLLNITKTCLLTLAPAFGLSDNAAIQISKSEAFAKTPSHLTSTGKLGALKAFDGFAADIAKHFTADEFEKSFKCDKAFSFEKGAAKYSFAAEAKDLFAGKAGKNTGFKAIA